ncbi:AAA family ATPase [Streptomyces pinistramenti]|uniref:AAA family ATPase n=1 Tax=Streptomyces pinistramenti TaxID=2884812 RepID=UPI001D05C429|nr:LuxR family transcriptional regulator [Streptomyces pinistramenti]MCB5906095.1 AAA family ATPase [Streptomyces pinistramenti]
MTAPAGFHPLHERDEQLASLHRLLVDSLNGPTRFAIISGPAGCGKTELLRTFAREATSSGAAYLSATASRTEHLVPFGVWAQLFRSAGGLTPSAGGDLSRPLDGKVLSSVTGAAPQDGSTPLSAQVIHTVCLPLLDVIEKIPGPVVIGIDDFQNADAVSLQCLAAVVRRLGPKPVLVVLGESSDRPSADASLQAELPLEPHSRRLRLWPLSRSGVQDLLRQHLGRAAAQRLADACYDITAGNPLQVHGLIADNQRADAGSGDPAVDSGYAAAVLSCLHRCGLAALSLAQHIALIDGPATTRVLTQLAGVDSKTLMRTLSTLDDAGILSGNRFRHPKTRAVILDNMAPEKRAGLRARVAEVLYRSGAAPLTVARQLLAAAPVPAGDWPVAILDEAARAAVRDGMLDLAHDCLVLARELEPADEKLLASITATLFDIEWRTDPCAAVRGLPSLAAATRSGALTGSYASIPVTAPLWFGDVDSAVAGLRQISAAPEVHPPGTAAHVQASQLWLRLGYPAAAGSRQLADIPDDPAGTRPPVDPLSPQVQGAVLLSRLSGGGPDTELADEAERLVRRYRLNQRTFAVLTSCLITLLFSDRLEIADEACRRLTTEANQLSSQTWRALFTALRAEVALRRGDLPTALRLAHTSLSVISHESWGVGIGLPLATLVQAGIAAGRFDVAHRALQVPVPDEMFQTPIGLHYMQARGHHHLATHQEPSALEEFLTAGDLAQKYKMDVPALVPWRSEAARVYLTLGDQERARELAQAQLDLCTALHARARGAALRILAACAAPGRRTPLLEAAAAAFRECGATRELAATLEELTKTEEESRPPGPPPNDRRIAPDTPARLTQTTRTPRQTPFPRNLRLVPQNTERRPTTDLSEAERRVAELAARGHSNRQIAARLYITVSTVEQHLTRVYRKLRVKRRTDLAAGLRSTTPPQAEAAAGR